MVVQNDFVPYGYLPYCFNLTWIALAVNCIWLIKVSSSHKNLASFLSDQQSQTN